MSGQVHFTLIGVQFVPRSQFHIMYHVSCMYLPIYNLHILLLHINKWNTDDDKTKVPDMSGYRQAEQNHCPLTWAVSLLMVSKFLSHLNGSSRGTLGFFEGSKYWAYAYSIFYVHPFTMKNWYSPRSLYLWCFVTHSTFTCDSGQIWITFLCIKSFMSKL